jgi:hypothetical protein
VAFRGSLNVVIIFHIFLLKIHKFFLTHSMVAYIILKLTEKQMAFSSASAP